MPLASVPGPTPVVEIDPDTSTLIWQPADQGNTSSRETRQVPWFPGVGVLDYASARPVRRSWRWRRTGRGPSAEPAPVYGTPLIVRTDLAAVFWRSGTLLYSAPIQRRRVDFTAAAPVDWAANPGEFVVIEHNLAQLTDLPTVAPPLHVVRVDANGRLSVALLVADAEGCPVIGPATHHDLPCLFPHDVPDAADRGLASVAAAWEIHLRRGDRHGSWRMLAGHSALDTLAEAGFTVTGAATAQLGLVTALAAATEQWTTGWYGGTRLLTLARYEPRLYGGDLHYDYRKPGHRPVAVAAGSTRFDHDELVDWFAPADIETRPVEEEVYVEVGYVGGARMVPVPAGRVALMEPTLLQGPLPPLGGDPLWLANCRRCGVPMTSGEVGRDWLPYVHGLHAISEDSTWCAAHPDTGRRRPHAPLCWVA